MSVVNLQQLKQDLRITSTSQDEYLQTLLDGAHQEALDFMNRQDFPYPHSPAITGAIFILVRAVHSVEDMREAMRHRAVAERMLQPYRIEMGV